MCISFAITDITCGFAACDGIVYEDGSAQGPIAGDYYRRSDAATDEKIRSEFRGAVGLPGWYYFVGYNCRDFVRQVFDRLVLQYGGSTHQPGK